MPTVIVRQGDEEIDLNQPFIFTPQMYEKAEEWMHDTYPLRTICNVLREIYAMSGDQLIRQKCCEAIWMAKNMNKRLRHYKNDWDNGLWVRGPGENHGG